MKGLVLIRADASEQIGSGHLMRCLSIAKLLRARDHRVEWICRELRGHLADLVRAEGFTVHLLPPPTHSGHTDRGSLRHGSWLEVDWSQDAQEVRQILSQQAETVQWLIVDHYALDRDWEEALRNTYRHLLVIDDLADRAHCCDLLLDQNLHPGGEGRYRQLVPPDCRLAIGPSYALLRPEFTDLHEQLSTVERAPAEVKRLLIFCGGMDPSNQNGKALQALEQIDTANWTVDLVVGAQSPHREALRELCAARPGTNFHCQSKQIAQLIGQADLCVGAGGSSIWERCCLGLPTLTLILADNQREITEYTAKCGLLRNLGPAEKLSSSQLAQAIQQLAADQNTRQEMATRGMQLVDGRGAERLVTLMEGFQ